MCWMGGFLLLFYGLLKRSSKIYCCSHCVLTLCLELFLVSAQFAVAGSASPTHDGLANALFPIYFP